jgi:superfamily II DNA or RNA helicase
MTDTFALRDYQSDAIDAIEKSWAGGTTRPAVVLPTGAGKTVVFSHLAARQHERAGRTLVLAHREELLNQAAAKIRSVAPHLKTGIVKAERDEHDGADIVIGSIQTLAVPRRRERIGQVGLVIVDEAHHAAADSYRTVLDHFGCFDGTPTAGFTATMSRQDGGLAEVWHDVVFRLDILTMIARGFLVDVRGKSVVVEGLDLTQVNSRGGDYQEGQLGAALAESGAAKAVADAYLRFASDRPGVVFTPTVETAMQMTDVLNEAGISTACVWGEMTSADRRLALDRYQKGDIQVLANCMVLTEGFDAPWASCCVVARPTRSASLYVQMVGRVLRPFHAGGKKDALVLDVAGVTGRHKLASIVDLTEAKIAAVRDEETLGEAAEEAGIVIKGNAIKVSGWTDVDLFEESAVSWQHTRGGQWFVAVPNREYFLVRGEEPETYRVRSVDKSGAVSSPPDDRDVSLTFAMQQAEGYARRQARSIAERGARWRGQAPSDKQLELCRKLQIPVPKGATKGAVNDLVSVAFASKRIDPYAARIAGASK